MWALKKVTVILGRKKIRKCKNVWIRKQILKSWRKFCDQTKLAGLNLIGGTLRVSKYDRMLLFFVWSVCLTLRLFKCNSSIEKYMKYDVKTKFVYNSVPKQNFPAITFCNVNFMRKSVVGTMDALIEAMSRWLSQTEAEAKKTSEE